MNKLKIFVTFVVGIIFLLACLFVYVVINYKPQAGLLFGRGFDDNLDPKSPVVVSYDGLTFEKYKWQGYIPASKEYFSDYIHKQEFNDFKKSSGITGFLLISRPDEIGENFVFKIFAPEDKNKISEIWSFNKNNKSYKQISNDTKKYNGCDRPIMYDSVKNEIVMVDALDIGSTDVVRKFCKINSTDGSIIDTLKIPFINDTIVGNLQLYDYYIDSRLSKILFANSLFLLDTNLMTGKIIEIPVWKSFEIVSKKIFDGKIIVSNSANAEGGKSEFVIYDINDGNVSKVIDIKEQYAQFVDISPNWEHLLFKYFVRDLTITGGGNGYYCYVIIESKDSSQVGNFCSKDIAKDGIKMDFIGWVQ